MSKLARLMTKRASHQHRLDLLRSRGRIRGTKEVGAEELRGRIRSLTLQINTLLARQRKEAVEKARQTQSGPKKSFASDARPRLRPKHVAFPLNSRERAKRLRRAAGARFGGRSASKCARCRNAVARAMDSRRDEWTTINEVSWGIDTGDNPCYGFATEAGDQLDIRIKVVPPPYLDLELRDQSGQIVFQYSLEPGEYTFTHTSTGGTLTLCARNWISGEYFIVRHRRKKPNLVALGPHIWWDEQWVGFGYRVENNRIGKGSANAELRYAKKHETGPNVLLDTLRSRPIRPDEGTQLNWDNDPGNFRVPFMEMGVPPDEATHMVTVVDLDRTIDELDEKDNVTWHVMPEWRGNLEWADLTLTSVPTSVPRGKDAPKASRLMKIYELRFRAFQEIWRQRVVARHRCSIRVYLNSDRTGSGAGLRGWIFPPSMDNQLAGTRINIGDDVRIAEKHPPVNALREDAFPRGAQNSPSTYLFIPCDQLDQTTGELPLRYIPPTLKGTDEIRVELWDDILNKQIADPISRKITATQEYTLEWKGAFPSRVGASLLKFSGLADIDQATRVAVPVPITLRAKLNGVLLGPGHEVRLDMSGVTDEPGLGDHVGGWLFPRLKLYSKLFKKALLTFKPRKGFPGIQEPLAAGVVGGTATGKVYKVKTVEKGEVKLYYLPPCRGGTDTIRARLLARNASDNLAVVATAPQKPIEILRYGVRSLRCIAPTDASLSRLLPGVRGPLTAPKGNPDFAFAPGPGLDPAGGLGATAVDPIEIEYRLSNARSLITSAWLELLRDGDPKPIWTRALTPAELAHGTNKLHFGTGPAWDGAFGTHPDFPDGCLTVEFSPYTLRLVVLAGNGTNDSPIASTQVQVKLADLSLEFGPETAAPSDRGVVSFKGADLSTGGSRAILKSFGGKLPTTGNTVDLVLPCDTYKQQSSEMYDNTAFEVHEEQWGSGPRIPIFARLRIRGSDGSAVDAPRGLGFMNCLWDWKDETTETAALASIANPAAQSFVKDALNYYAASSGPPGLSCHADRGGKRGGKGLKVVFPQQNGYAPGATPQDGIFPFSVFPATNRAWAAFSDVWRNGIYAGMTGVAFEPSRMPGDRVSLTCYAAGKRPMGSVDPLDTTGDPSAVAELSAAIGWFGVWRKYNISRYVKKTAFSDTINVGAVAAYFRGAAMEMSPTYSNVEVTGAAAYNAAMASAVSGTLDRAGTAAIDPAVDQHAAGAVFVSFRPYKEFLSALKASFAFESLFDAWWLIYGDEYDTDAKYEAKCGEWARLLLNPVCDAFMPPQAGVAIFHFGKLHNIGAGDNLAGRAISVPSQTRHRVGFVTCALVADLVGTGLDLEVTTAHEIGHHLFLPHAPGVKAGPSAKPEFHDVKDTTCLMSYSPSECCGLCLLRLRGWNASALSNVGGSNRKP